MIGRGTAAAAALIVALLVDGLLPSGWDGAFTPDIVLASIGGAGLAWGARTGMYYGFSAGLATDLLSTDGLVGVTALVGMVLGWACGLGRFYLGGTSLPGQVAVITVGTGAAVAVDGVCALLLGTGAFTFPLLADVALRTGVSSGAAALVVLVPLRLRRRTRATAPSTAGEILSPWAGPLPSGRGGGRP